MPASGFQAEGGPVTPDSQPVLWIDGELVPLSRAYIPVTDHSFLAGDGVFETIGVIDGNLIGLTRHLERMHHSLSGLGLQLTTTDDAVVDALHQVVGANSGRCDWVRMTISGGDVMFSTERTADVSRIVIAPGITPPGAESISVVTAPWPRNERGALAGIKSTSYAENTVALAYARSKGAVEVLFSNSRGDLCEGATSNVFVVLDGELVTPPLFAGCLQGVTRDLLIECCTVTERPITMTELHDAAEVFLTSSVRDVIPVTRIDGQDLPIGPLTRAAQGAYAALIAENPDP